MSRETVRSSSFLSSLSSGSSSSSRSRSSDALAASDGGKQQRAKKGKLRDEMGDEAFLRGCEAGLERRLARLDRMGVLRSTASNPPGESSRRRDAGLSVHADRDRRAERAPSSSFTALVCRAAHSGDVDALETLLERMDRGDYGLLNARGPEGVPPLALAAARGHLQVVRALLTGRHRQHVDKDARSARNGRTAVHMAAKHGHYEVVKLLLLQGASPSQRDDAERTPVADAQRMGDDAMVALLRVGEARRKLLEVSARGDEQRAGELLKAGHSLLSDSPLRRSSSLGASSLERRSSSVESSAIRFAASLWQDALDHALLLAASSGHTRCVAMLVGRGADLDAAGQASGRSALHLAVRGGHLEVARYLLDHGSNPRAVDFDGRSVRDEAVKSKDRAITDLFVSSSGGHSGEFDRGDRRKLERRRSSVSWATEVTTRGGSNSDEDDNDYTTAATNSGAPPARRRTATDRSSSTASSTTSPRSRHGSSNSLHDTAIETRLASNLWEDPMVIAARIPLDKLEIGEAVSRGAYGDVYRGWYRGESVAIKKLHPSMSRDMAHISAFLGEIKLMAAMDHPQIVRFVGVAWDSLSEVCAVSELMAGGDLGAMLQDYRAGGAPRGFRRHPIKLKLAAEVAHALTYLHSLDPAVLHRDLKSRNILLTADRRSAKLTDFGTSRETSDATLTAGVGTSLWMAPEVIMGERYGVKADVFSLGVVLSELATHELPYAHATERETGRPLSIAAVLHAVVSGTIELDFAEREDDGDMEEDTTASLTAAAARELAKMARSCVRLEPADRPTAAQVACVLRRLLQAVSLDDEP